MRARCRSTRASWSVPVEKSVAGVGEDSGVASNEECCGKGGVAVEPRVLELLGQALLDVGGDLPGSGNQDGRLRDSSEEADGLLVDA